MLGKYQLQKHDSLHNQASQIGQGYMDSFISPDLDIDAETRHKIANDIQVEKLEAAIRRRERASEKTAAMVNMASADDVHQLLRHPEDQD